MPRSWQDQAAGLRQLLNHPPRTRSISFIGGRGQCGSTTITLNLAAALVERQRSVLLLDEHDGPMHTLGRLGITQHARLEHVVVQQISLEQLLHPTSAGFSVLPLAIQPQHLGSLNEGEQQQLALAMEQLGARFDYLLFDARPSLNRELTAITQDAHDIVLVVSPRAESLTDAYANIKLLHLAQDRRHFRLLVNRVDQLDEARQLQQRLQHVAQRYLETPIELRLIGFIPDSPQLDRATRHGHSVLQHAPDCEASLAFRQLADTMLRWQANPAHRGSPASLIYRMVETSRKLSAHIQARKHAQD